MFKTQENNLLFTKMSNKIFQDITKVDYSISKFIDKIEKPNILELGVQLGSSTKYFLELCKKKMENFIL